MVVSSVKLMNNNAVFVSAGLSPRMRFKRVRCPIVEVIAGTDPEAVKEALARGYDAELFGPRCKEEIMVFFKNVAICPVHGVIPTAEPWIEGNGGKS